MVKRKTVAERRHIREAAAQSVWESFQPKLQALQSVADACALVSGSPAPDAPGRKFYSNLAFFLQQFTVPGGSTQEERALYLQFAKRLYASGALNPGDLSKIEQSFRNAP